jgi:hypothetical protein
VAEYIKEAKQISCAARTSVSGINFKDNKKKYNRKARKDFTQSTQREYSCAILCDLCLYFATFAVKKSNNQLVL